MPKIATKNEETKDNKEPKIASLSKCDIPKKQKSQ